MAIDTETRTEPGAGGGGFISTEDRDRDVLWLQSLDFTHREIAQALGMAKATVTRVLAKARKAS
jgi:CRP-like cAMP-binding protein